MRKEQRLAGNNTDYLIHLLETVIGPDVLSIKEQLKVFLNRVYLGQIFDPKCNCKKKKTNNFKREIQKRKSATFAQRGLSNAQINLRTKK